MCRRAIRIFRHQVRDVLFDSFLLVGHGALVPTINLSFPADDEGGRERLNTAECLERLLVANENGVLDAELANS